MTPRTTPATPQVNHGLPDNDLPDPDEPDAVTRPNRASDLDYRGGLRWGVEMLTTAQSQDICLIGIDVYGDVAARLTVDVAVDQEGTDIRRRTAQALADALNGPDPDDLDEPDGADAPVVHVDDVVIDRFSHLAWTCAGLPVRTVWADTDRGVVMYRQDYPAGACRVGVLCTPQDPVRTVSDMWRATVESDLVWALYEDSIRTIRSQEGGSSE